MSLKNKHFSLAIVDSLPNKNWEEVFASLQAVGQLLRQTKELRNYLDSPRFSLPDKKTVLQEVFKKHLTEEAINILLMIVKNNALSELAEILAQAHQYYLSKNNLKEAQVESVIALTSSQEQELGEILAKQFNQKIVIKNIINPSIKAGLKIQINDLVIDVSLQNKLNKLNQFIN